MDDGKERSFYSVLDELYAELKHEALLPSYFSDMLFSLKKQHEKEMTKAAHAFLAYYEDGYDAEAAAIRIIKNHARDCDRADLRRRITEYYANPGKTRTFEDFVFEGNSISYMDVLQLIMHPNDCWTAGDFYHRLMYLLGDDLEEV